MVREEKFKMSVRLGVFVGGLIAFIFVSSCGTANGVYNYNPSANNDQPIPSWIKIVKPAADVSPEIARFSGAWKGRYIRNRDVAVVVMKIDNEDMQVLYSWGASGGGGAVGYRQIFGPFTRIGDSIQFRWNGITVTLSPGYTSKEVNLTFYNERKGFKASTTLGKFKLTEHN